MPIPPIPDPASTALFLDIDGTLVEHCAHPDGVAATPELLQLLGRLRDRLGGAVAFVTGRDMAMIDRLFGSPDFAAAGTFGLELRHGSEVRMPETAAVAPVFAALEKRFRDRKGLYFEHKGPVLAVHSRAAPDAFDEVAEACRAAMADLPGYRIVAGNAGLELLPEGATKSAAIAWFMSRPPFRDRLPVFLGDDTSDESGFEWINGHGGLSIRVRPEHTTAARYGLATVRDVHHWLASLLDGG